MLDERDIMLLSNLLDQKLDEKLDKRFADFELKLDEKLDRRFADFELKLDKKLDKRFVDFELKLDKKLDKRFAESENLVLGEMERIRILTDEKIEHLQARLDELTQYYQITKLSEDNSAILLRMIRDLQDRVEVLEHKIA